MRTVLTGSWFLILTLIQSDLILLFLYIIDLRSVLKRCILHFHSYTMGVHTQFFSITKMACPRKGLTNNTLALKMLIFFIIRPSVTHTWLIKHTRVCTKDHWYDPYRNALERPDTTNSLKNIFNCKNCSLFFAV